MAGFIDERPRESTERQEKFIGVAKRLASKSDMAHRHGCVLVLGDEIISTGYNQYIEHFCHKFSIHAEVDALVKVKKRLRPLLPSCELYVVRIGPKSMEGCLKYSRPCPDCARWIRKMGIGKVYYSTNYDYEQFLETKK